MGMKKFSKEKTEQLFWERVQKSNDHWIWTGGKYSGGYGQHGKTGAHVSSWTYLKGEVPTGYSVMHSCGVKLCVNPDHLFLLANLKIYLNLLYEYCLQYKPQQCILWQRTKNDKGYGSTYNNKYAHRAMWELANDVNIPKGMIIMHSCDNPQCVNFFHLKIGTYHDNTQDMLKKKRHGWWVNPNSILRGEKQASSKLTEYDVRSIKLELKNGITRKKLANKYKVSYNLISQIDRNESWVHIN